MREQLRQELSYWVLFSLILPVIPLIAKALSITTYDIEKLSFEQLVSHGELVLITFSICAVGLGRLFVGTTFKGNAMATAIAGSTVIILLLAALYFSNILINEIIPAATAPNPNKVAKISLVLCIAGMALSTACVFISERNRCY